MKLTNKIFCIIITVLLIYLTIIATTFINSNNTASVNSNNQSKVTIVLDAGHGGEDGGAVANDVVEKEINLSITLKLAEIFKSSGYDVILTRSTDDFVDAKGSTLRERKVSDMKNRLKIFNSCDENIVISIHQNKFTQEKYCGTQIFYSTNNSESSILANNIQSSVVTLIQPENIRQCKSATEDIYLLKNAEVPAIIVECGFISNINEANNLKSNDYQNKLSYAIFMGFMEYYNN